MRASSYAKGGSTYNILGIRSAELNMVGNKYDRPPLHKRTLDTFLKQVIGGMSIN